jgi:ketosteroid isomerase-like protein
MRLPKVLIFAAVLIATAFATDADDPLTQMTSQERRFAEVCKQVGIRDSFLQFFDDRVITFGPELRVGTSYLKKRPPDTPSSPLLEWQATYGDVSADGDLGYSTGPSTLTLHPDDPATRKVLNLVFFSIWRKNPAGDWKVIFDGGLTTPSPMPAKSFQRAPVPAGIHRTAAAPSLAALRDTDHQFSDLARNNGFVSALDQLAESTIRVNRDNHLPVQGIEQARELLQGSSSYKFVARDVAVASSGDLGYSYGDVTTATAVKFGSYVRVWRRHSDGWKLAFDMLLPLE